jgi:glycosyltransferase involved in cell wall biosynthesis
MISGFEPVDWHIRHMWPPYWNTACGPLVIAQPWEFGVIPDEWVDPLMRRTYRVVVPSLAVREMFLASGIPDTKIHVIPHGVNPAIFHPFGSTIAWDGTPRTVFLWIGGFLPRKGLDILTRAYRKAFRRTDDVLLVIKAVGQTTSYRHSPMPSELADALNDPTSPPIQVIFDDLSEADMATLYRSVTCLVSPYRGEGFNLPVLEAMASGCLVIASDTNPTNEFVPADIGWRIRGTRQYEKVSHSVHLGWHFEPDDEALVGQLQEVANLSVAERLERGERGRQWALGQYTWEHVWQKWASLLQDPPVNNHWVIPAPLPNTIIWHGPVRNASGYSSEARSFLKALPSLGILPRMIDDGGGLAVPSVTDNEETFFAALETIPVNRTTLAIHSLPAGAAVRRRQGTDLLRTMFETNALPPEWATHIKQFAGVLVPSTFNRDTFAETGIGPETISVVPSPVDTDLYRPPSTPPSTDYLRFISIFDWIDRKGWDILIKAWIRAFTAHDPVVLIIKTTRLANPLADPGRAIGNLLEAEGCQPDQIAPIQVIQESWHEPQLAAFYQQGHVFVLPTRGEGWGRPILEAMATALLVIATYWSGPTDYLNSENGLLLEAKSIKPVPATVDMPILRGQSWAEPDIDQLVWHLRWAAEHYHQTAPMRQRARATAERYHPHQVALTLVEVLKRYGVEPSALSLQRR